MTDQFLADVYHHLIYTLRGTLPSPPTDSAEDIARRDEAAIERIAALSPANAVEVDQAALHVAFFEHWKDCLRLAEQSEAGSGWAEKHVAQANSMLRSSQTALKVLLQMQAARRKLEADPVASARAARDRETALRLMTKALSELTEQPARAAVAKPAAPAAGPKPPAPAADPKPQPEPKLGRRRQSDPLVVDEAFTRRKWVH
jgi:hypothetical protein